MRHLALALALALCLIVLGCYSRANLQPRPTPSPATMAIEVVNDGLLGAGVQPRAEALLRSDVLSKNIAVPVVAGGEADLKLLVRITSTNFTAATAYEWQLIESRSGRIIAQGAEAPALGHEGEQLADAVIAGLIGVDTLPYASDPKGAVAAVITPPDSANPPNGSEVMPTSKTPGQDAWAVIIGVERYRNELPAATHAEDDARAFKALARQTLGVPEGHIKLLIGERASRTDIAGAIFEWLPRNAVREGGTVYVFFSGHGAPDIDTGEGYLVPYDADPAYLKTGGVSIGEIQAALSKLKGQRSFVFLDACFSGRGERSVLASGTRPLVPVKEVEAVGGVITISAAGAREATGAHEGSPQGLFTHHLIRAMVGGADQDGNRDVTLAEIVSYVAKAVEDEARLQNREQRPTATVPGGVDARGVIVIKGLDAR